MKNKLTFVYITVFTAIFVGILLFIRVDNNSQVSKKYYTSWHQNYLTKNKNIAFVNTTPHSAKQTVLSESQGYGMLIMTSAAKNSWSKKADFEKLYQYYLAHRDKNTQLMSWKQTFAHHKYSNLANSATDGDIYIAEALIQANKIWKEPKYLLQAQKICHDILAYEYNPSTQALTVGNWANAKSKYYNLFRPSDVMPQYFDDFYKITNNSTWLTVKNSMLNYLYALSKQNKNGLVPDFAIIKNGKAHPVITKITTSKYDGDYYANSCRIPLFLANYKDPRASKITKKMLRFFSKQNELTAGYTLKGKALNHYQSASFSAPIFYAVDHNRNQDFDNLFISQQYIFSKSLPKNNYYDATLTTLVALS